MLGEGQHVAEQVDRELATAHAHRGGASEGHEVGEQAARRIGHVGHDERTTGAVPEEHTVDGHVGVDPSVGLTATGQRLVLGTAEGETHQPHVLGTRGKRGLHVITGTIIFRGEAIVVTGNHIGTTGHHQRVAITIKAFGGVLTGAVIGGGQGAVVACGVVRTARAKLGHTDADRKTRRRVRGNLINPVSRLGRTHRRVQRQLGGGDVRAVDTVDKFGRGHIPPLPGSSIEGLGRRAVNIVIEDREETVPALIAVCDSRVRQANLSEDGVVVGGVTVDLFVDVVSAAHFHHRLIRRRNDQDARVIRSKLVVGTMETDGRHIAFVQPVQVTQSTTEVHLEVEL